MYRFRAPLEIIGVNPFVFVPKDILENIFKAAQKDKGPVPVCGTINDAPYTQTLVRFAGEWRLYINTKMLKNSPQRIGETVHIAIAYDAKDRSIVMHPLLRRALESDEQAHSVFRQLSPSRQHEIVRYIAHLKSEEKVAENVARAIRFLHGKERFVGRDKP